MTATDRVSLCEIEHFIQGYCIIRSFVSSTSDGYLNPLWQKQKPEPDCSKLQSSHFKKNCKRPLNSTIHSAECVPRTVIALSSYG